MGIVVMLNNLFHDFAVALLAASLFVLYYLYRASLQAGQGEGRMDLVRHLYGRMSRIIIACWVVIILGGVGRTLAFEQYEWMEAAGRGQIAALVVKHIILVSLVVAGTIVQRRLKRIITS